MVDQYHLVRWSVGSQNGLGLCDSCITRCPYSPAAPQTVALTILFCLRVRREDE